MREILRELIRNNPIGASRKIYSDHEIRNWVEQHGYGNTFAEKIRTAVFQDSDVFLCSLTSDVPNCLLNTLITSIIKT